MRTFDELVDLAAHHHGGRAMVLAKINNDHAVADLAQMPDSHFLSLMTRGVFGAGFSWQVIDNKWPGFEAAFANFDPHRVAFYSDEDMDRLLSDKGIVRNGAKIKATIENARFVVETKKTHGSFGVFLANWPADDQAGLIAHLAKYGSRLGGNTGQYFLRFSGYDAWVASKDVCAAHVREGVLDKPTATSKTALRKIDQTVTALAKQGKMPRASVSKLLAFSVG